MENIEKKYRKEINNLKRINKELNEEIESLTLRTLSIANSPMKFAIKKCLINLIKILVIDLKFFKKWKNKFKNKLRNIIYSRTLKIEKTTTLNFLEIQISYKKKQVISFVDIDIQKFFKEVLPNIYKTFSFLKAIEIFLKNKIIKSSLFIIKSFCSNKSRVNFRNNENYDIFIFSVIDWHFRFQRPQHLATAFAKSKHRVFYISNNIITTNKYGYEIERVSKDFEIYQIKLFSNTFKSIYNSLPTKSNLNFLKKSLGKLFFEFNITNVSSIINHPYWYELAYSLPNLHFVYDLIDHHEGFGEIEKSILNKEIELIKSSDLVTVTSDFLETFAKKYNSKTRIINNAADFLFFSKIPKKKYSNKKFKKIIGYYGAIAEWFDIELIIKIAKSFKNHEILLIGADTVNAYKKFNNFNNITMIGEVPFEELTYYLYSFDICLIPFKVNNLTLATNPVKIYEYLCSGKPTITTELPELKKLNKLVYLAKTHDDFIKKISNLNENNFNLNKLIKQRKTFAYMNNWDQRCKQYKYFLNDLYFPKINIIVLSYNNFPYTENCIESIIKYTNYPNFKIILVDNNSNNETKIKLKKLNEKYKNLELVFNKENFGFAKGNNIGLNFSKADYYVILNNDTVVTNDWLLTFYRHFKKDEKIGLLGPVTNNIGNEARIKINYKNLDMMHLKAKKYTSANFGSTFKIRNLGFFCVMISDEILKKVGFLCEEYGRGFFEDDDYCRRVEKIDFKIICAKDVFIHHHLSASFSKLAPSYRNKLFEKNRIIYEKKWGEWIPHEYIDSYK